MFNSLKSVIFPSNNLEADKAFWTKVLGVEPYFDQPYYVGFHVADCELGLDPNASQEGLTHPVAYWNVADAAAMAEKLKADGVEQVGATQDVGGGMHMARLKDASGNIFGVIDEQS